MKQFAFQMLGMNLDVRKVSKTVKARALVTVFLTLAVAVTGFAQPLDKAKLDQLFDRLAAKNKAMGSLVIAKDGNILYSRAIGYGQINAAEKKQLTAASRFAIASITKTYTAVMILQLVEKGKLKLTDTLDRFFPQVPNAEKITILQILSHRSGIPNVMPDRRPGHDGNPMMTREDMLSLIVKATPDFEPDSKSSYSNSGYFVLALILEKVTGKSYAVLLKSRIISKIGLKDTYLASDRIDVTKNEALTYFNLANEWKLGRETHPVIFEIISTPGDLARFVEALFDLKFISQRSLDRMKTIRDGEGLGIVPFNFAGKTFYGNTGGGDNYGSWLAYEPEEKLAVAYTTNAKVYPVAKIISGVVDIYYNKPFQVPSFESVAVSNDILDQYVGVYASADAPGKATISRVDSTLFFQPPGAPSAVALEAIAENKFQIEGLIVITFDAAKNLLTIKRGAGERVLTKER